MVWTVPKIVNLRRFIINSKKTIICFVLVFLLGSVFCFTADAAERKTSYDPKREQILRRWRFLNRAREAYEKAKAKLEEEISEIDLPQDTTQRISVKEVQISGNTLLTTEELLDDMPLIYNDSSEPLKTAGSENLYDFRVLHDIILEPGRARQVSTRTIRGFTQCIVSVYRNNNYAGIYVYVPSQVMIDGERLRDDILHIEVLEATVSEISTISFSAV